MEKFYLEKPAIDKKTEAIHYLKEHVAYNSRINGSGGLNRLLNGLSYEEWLDDVIKSEDSKTARESGRVPTSTYFMIRESDHKLIGMLNFRQRLNDELAKHGGHFGYGIRPTERGKGYSKILLYLGLLKAQEISIDCVLILCEENNIASEKTIKALGGTFDRIEYEPRKDRNLKKYWIDVEKSCHEYKNLYDPFISIQNK